MFLRPLFPAATALFALLILAGCRDSVEGTWPSGKPKAIRSYTLFGAKDTLHMTREQTFYFNDKPEMDARWKKGNLHGTYREFWQNGQKRSFGEYVDGKRQGEWEFYFNEFSVASKGVYKDGRKEGTWSDFHENGNLRAQGNFHEGRETGTWKRWAKGGDLIEENSCYEANAEGVYKSFHAGNTPKEEYRCEKGLPQGLYVKKFAEGEVEEQGAFDSEGRKEGPWEKFHPGNALAERRTYRAGLEADSLVAWDAKGRIKEKGFFVEGKGEVLGYDSLGNLVERSRRTKGAPDGESWTYFRGGKTQGLVLYREGKPVFFKRWHANGKPAAEGGFEDGKRSGLWTRFGSKGQTLEASHYDNGLLHGERKLYDSTGTLMQVQRYEKGYPAEGRIPGGVKPNYGTSDEPK